MSNAPSPPGRLLAKNNCRAPLSSFSKYAPLVSSKAELTARANVHRGLPAEVVVGVPAVRDPNVQGSKAPRAVALEEKPVLIPGQARASLGHQPC